MHKYTIEFMTKISKANADKAPVAIYILHRITFQPIYQHYNLLWNP